MLDREQNIKNCSNASETTLAEAEVEGLEAQPGRIF